MYHLAYANKQNTQLINKFAAVGIHTTDDLLRAGNTAGKRRHLAGLLGMTTRRLMLWMNRADLARINGIGEEYAHLLEASQIRSVTELATHNPTQLRQILEQTNRSRRLVQRIPSLTQLQLWIEHAQTLPPAFDI